MDSNVETERPGSSFFVDAQRRVAAGDLRGGLRALLCYFREEPLHREGLRAAARLSRHLGAPKEGDLFDAVSVRPDDPRSLYELGYFLVESGRPGLGARYLEQCLAIAEHPLVRYELGYARFLSGDHAGAAPLLTATAEDADLGGPAPSAARALLVETHLGAGDLAEARAAFDRLERTSEELDPAQLDALAQMLARAATFETLDGLRVRDRHFIEHGGIVLDDVEPSLGAGRPVDPVAMAGLLRTLIAVLDALDFAPVRVQHASGRVEPIARALAGRLVAVSEAYCAHPLEPTLVVVKDPDDAAALVSVLRRHEETVGLLALALNPGRDHAIVPDVVGWISAKPLLLPGEGRLEIAGEDRTRLRMEQIAANAEEADRFVAGVQRALGEIEDDGAAVEVASYYAARRELLVLGNDERYPARRVYTARRLPT